MSETGPVQSSISHVTSSVYEIVVYFGSTSLAVILGCTSLIEFSTVKGSANWIATLGAVQQIIMLIVSVTIAYVYGQLASTISSTVIGRQLRRISRILPDKYSSDFKYDFRNAIDMAGLKDTLPPEKANNKWTLLFFIQSKNPEIARDLMKRQMRERLARLNALNMLILFVFTSSHVAYTGLGHFVPPGTILKYEVSINWPISFGILCGLFCYEFFKRASWNNDLIVKVLPAVIR